MYTNEELLASLKIFYNEQGRAPKTSDCAKYKVLKGKGTYALRFGSFTKALIAAGIPTRRSITKFLSDAELLDSIRQFYRENGRAPSHTDCSPTSYMASHTTYSRRFGTFLEAVNLAKVPQNTNNSVFLHKTDDELLQGLRRFYKENAKPPNAEDCRDTKYLSSYSTYRNRFGAFAKALELAEVLDVITDEDIINNLKKFYKLNNRPPNQAECATCTYLSSWGTYYYRFGSLREALELAKIPTAKNTSVAELELLEFIKSIYVGEIIQGDRKVLKGKELDILLPSSGIAIEYNGLYWHSESRGKDKNYHLNKTKKAQEADIRLIHIFENEWIYKKDIVKSRLSNALGLSNAIYARKCTTKELDSSTSKAFLDKSHIQGNANASVRLGLYYKDDLIAVMTFCKNRFGGNTEWELLRYCNRLNTSVVGGASKLVKTFIKTKDPSSIVSYSDIRWNTGVLYDKLGFKLSHQSNPNYWYFKRDKLESRLKYQKHKLGDILDTFDPKKSEYENMLDNGYDRVWDCGNKVFIWERRDDTYKGIR